jgi:hypothetical protein
MTTYVVIPDGDIDLDSPVNQPLMTALRDNPIAIAESDTSVPTSLRARVLLGTLNTTSGAVQTLSGLDLSSFARLSVIFTGISYTGIGTSFYVGASIIKINTGNTTDLHYGIAEIDLGTGTATILGGVTGSAAGTFSGNSTIVSATTSISVTLVGGGTFDLGAVKFYGVK